MKPNLLSSLNSEQRKAVEITTGPILIQAGAGSGKTKTLTHKIAYLLFNNLATENSILAVTFTNKAANEMRDRVASLLNKNNQKGYFMPYMGTFHSICVKILRQDSDYLDISKSFIIFDENDKNLVLKRIFKQLLIDDKTYSPKSIASIISNAKNDLSIENGFNNPKSPIERVVNQVYPFYVKALKEASALDFDDLILKTVSLLKNYESVRQKWRRQFSHILIDEYQDTNMAQYQLIKMLINDQKNIVVVGDDWQSIYSWRGANYRNILKFEQDFKNCQIIKLEQNYRSTKHILDVAHNIIINNHHRSDKKLWTEADSGLPVKIIQVANERIEAESIVSTIRDSMSRSNFQYRDCAVLYRTNAQSRVLEETFLRFGLPYQIVGGQRFYDRKEIKDIVAYLRLIFQPEDSISFERIINIPSSGIGAKSILNFLNFKQENNYSLKTALEKVNEVNGIGPKVIDNFIKFADLLTELRQLLDSKVLVTELIDVILSRLNYLDYLNDGTIQGESRQENVKELLSVAESYSDDVGLFLEEVSLVSDIDTADFKNNAITLMTLHAAKGLEFEIVFIAGMEETILPHSRSLYDQFDMEEERRLCYVGMTRAKKELYLYYATSRLLYGALLHNPPSRFLSEINELSSVEVSSPAYNQFEPLSLKTNNDEPRYIPEISVGDMLEHALFGTGQVTEIKDDMIVIMFNKFGYKTLNINFAPLQKK